jgi:hypothetical protein
VIRIANERPRGVVASTHATPGMLASNRRWWAMQGSNLAPLPCEYTAPVVLISLPSRFASNTVFAVCFAVFCATGYVLQAAQIALAIIFDLVKIHVLFSGYIWAITAQ